jgi:hypothetical protein
MVTTTARCPYKIQRSKKHGKHFNFTAVLLSLNSNCDKIKWSKSSYASSATRDFWSPAWDVYTESEILKTFRACFVAIHERPIFTPFQIRRIRCFLRQDPWQPSEDNVSRMMCPYCCLSSPCYCNWILRNCYNCKRKVLFTIQPFNKIVYFKTPYLGVSV